MHGVDITGATGERRRQLRTRTIGLVAEHRRDLLLLDEPLTDLDPGMRLRFVQTLRWLRTETNGATVVASRDAAVAGLLADRVVVLHRGEVVESGSVSQVIDAAGHSVLGAYPDALIKSRTA
jgi:ABC-type glutathione transport system ATPase component